MGMVEEKIIINKLDQYIASGTKPEKSIIDWILREAVNIDIRYRNPLVFKSAKAILPHDIDLFWRLAELLYPSLTYIFLMALAIEIRGELWKKFYSAGETCIEELPYNEKSMGYAELSRSIINKDKIIAHNLSLASLKTLPFSLPTIIGGVAINLAKNFIKIGFSIRQYIISILNIISAVTLIESIEKIHILTKIALFVSNINREIALKAVEKATYLMKTVSIFNRFEAETILSNTFSRLFDNPDELIRFSERIPREAYSAIGYALVRIIQDRQEKPFYEIDLEGFAEGESTIIQKINERLKRKKEIRKEIMIKLSRILIKRKNDLLS